MTYIADVTAMNTIRSTATAPPFPITAIDQLRCAMRYWFYLLASAAYGIAMPFDTSYAFMRLG